VAPPAPVKVEPVRAPAGWKLKMAFPPPPAEGMLGGPLTFSPDGMLLLCGHGLLDLATGRDLAFHRFRSWPGLAPEFLGFSPDGRAWGLQRRGAVPGQAPAEYAVVDWVSGRERATLRPGALPGARRFALAPDGRTLAVGLGGAVTLWDVATGQKIADLPKRHVADVELVAFAPDGKTLATAGNRPWLYGATERLADVKLWDVASRKERLSLTDRLWVEGGGTGLGDGWMRFSPDGRRLAVPGARDAEGPRRVGLLLLDARTLKDLGSPPGDGFGVVTAHAFRPDGKVLALLWSGPPVEQDRPPVRAPLTVMDLDTGKEIARFEPPRSGYSGVAFSPDGRLLATADGQGALRLWEAPAGR
jgi:WD40 repeat protein